MKRQSFLSVLTISVLILMLAVGLVGCTSPESEAPEAETPETTQPTEEPTEGTETAGTIVEVAAGDPRFSTLVQAIQAAGLEETLSSGEYTVFAPTNEAFEALPEGTLDDLLADPQGDLTEVLTYHVVEGRVMAADVAGLDGQEVPTVNGGTLRISVDGGAVKVNDANVTETDIEASNGVIHVIDAVLVP